MEVQTMLFVRCFAILIVVILSWATGQTVTVPHATANGPATGGTDYQSKSGTLTFNPGETSKPITVMVTDDTLDEANETFFVNRSTTTNATIADNQGLGTILNYDGVPTLISGKVKSIGTGRGLYAIILAYQSDTNIITATTYTNSTSGQYTLTIPTGNYSFYVRSFGYKPIDLVGVSIQGNQTQDFEIDDSVFNPPPPPFSYEDKIQRYGCFFRWE